MNIKGPILCLIFCASVGRADTYGSLLRRYEKQIRHQERELKSLKSRLDEKARDVTRWQSKAESAKASWSEASASLEETRLKMKLVHQKAQQTRIQADAALWKTTENVLVSRSAGDQARLLAQEIYGKDLIFRSSSQLTVEDSAPEFVFAQMTQLSASSKGLADAAQREEAALRTEEMHWQTEEQSRLEEADRLHQAQEAQWLKWQQALRRKTALEDEISQMDQSAKALQVMVQELHDHRDQAKSLHDNRGTDDRAIASLKGTLPWPAQGRVVQTFGRQYSDGLNQLVVSNGIKIEAGASHTVRVIQEGKVLFANAFHQYGQLVIIQHKAGLTSVYAGLGQTQVQEGQMVAALDQIGSTGDNGSFYFELRHDEQPVNPLAYLTPVPSSELSSRRKFQ